MGIFDRSTTGHITAPVTVTLERGAMIFFAETIGETDPIYLDPTAAHAAGHPDILAPLTYIAVIGTEAGKTAHRLGQTDFLDLIRADLRVLLHGNENYSYHGPLYAGDTVDVRTEIVGFVDAKGGQLEIAKIRQTMTHPERGLVVDIKRDLIHRLSHEAAA
ncbi:MaoC family dehydratase N-terminal domain-containing protein [Shimia sp.]|uniref:FAS1-like dehydratase domain-containing protein n=1 Tax=Shimia sp. TaxID=1954381 RepID=UPI0032993D5A